jgi:hypothetical protein
MKRQPPFRKFSSKNNAAAGPILPALAKEFSGAAGVLQKRTFYCIKTEHIFGSYIKLVNYFIDKQQVRCLALFLL